MTCVQLASSCDGICHGPLAVSTGEIARTPDDRNRPPAPGLAAAKRFLLRHVGRGRGYTASIPTLARVTGIKERTLEGMRSDTEPQNISIDQAGKIARAFDTLDSGLGAAFLTAIYADFGYAIHRVGIDAADPLCGVALAGAYVAAACAAASQGAPSAAQADLVLDRLDRAVDEMLRGRSYYARRRGS